MIGFPLLSTAGLPLFSTKCTSVIYAEFITRRIRRDRTDMVDKHYAPWVALDDALIRREEQVMALPI